MRIAVFALLLFSSLAVRADDSPVNEAATVNETATIVSPARAWRRAGGCVHRLWPCGLRLLRSLCAQDGAILSVIYQNGLQWGWRSASYGCIDWWAIACPATHLLLLLLHCKWASC